MFLAGLILLRDDPPSESAVAETFAYWQDNQGQHQIIAMILVPLISFLLIFFGSGLRRRLDHGGGAILAAAMFAVVGMLEAAMTNAADDGQRQAVYTLNQFHSYDWLGWNAA